MKHGFISTVRALLHNDSAKNKYIFRKKIVNPSKTLSVRTIIINILIWYYLQKYHTFRCKLRRELYT